jgi:hypothetical protein
MVPSAVLVRTPTDFRATLGGHDFATAYLMPMSPEIEPEIRRVSDSIFKDLQNLTVGDIEEESLYLKDIEEPLKELGTWGVALFAIITKGNMRFPDGKESKWRRTHYVFVLRDGYFQLVEDRQHAVHRFRAECETLVSEVLEVISKGKQCGLWLQPDQVKKSLELDVPWCSTCCLEESLKY